MGLYLECLGNNTRINTPHKNEDETRSPREATKFRPNLDQDLRRQPFVGGFPYIFSVIHVVGRGSYLDEQDFQRCVN